MPRHIIIFPYRQIKEGITQDHAKGKVSSIPNYTRINRLDIKINNTTDSKEFKDEYIVIAIDSTGIKVINRGLGGCKISGI